MPGTTRNAEPLKWAEVREHYWKRNYRDMDLMGTAHLSSFYRCRYCGLLLKSSRDLSELRDHLTEQHADKLKQGE